MPFNFVNMTNEARRRARWTGTFTDKPEEKDGMTYLVKDIQLVIDAFLVDLLQGDEFIYNNPGDFLDAHGIGWE